jgi:hypothetical protein
MHNEDGRLMEKGIRMFMYVKEKSRGNEEFHNN